MDSALPPELFAMIASFLPLSLCPSTLLSLALANRQLRKMALPLLYERLILKNENDALAVFRKILNDPPTGLAVNELYVMSEFSLSTEKEGEDELNVVSGIRKIVEQGLLPRLSVLGIYLTQHWSTDAQLSYGRLPNKFWKNLRSQCPRLRAIVLRNVTDAQDYPVISRSIINDMSLFTLSTLSLYFKEDHMPNPVNLSLLSTLSHLAPSLERLALGGLGELADADLIMRFRFPNLKSIQLCQFLSIHNETRAIMKFWRQHPWTEGIAITDCTGRWFTNEVDSSFLPNLRHLKATFEDVRALAPILHRLTSLSITKSWNAQIPYLLRAVIPNGLPGLKSLEFNQSPSTDSLRDLSRIEGAKWYEKPDGTFCVAETLKEAERPMTDNFMHSIVKGAPNLEELAIHYPCFFPERLASISPHLAEFPALQRFYTRGFYLEKDHHPVLARTADKVTEFLSVANTLAKTCPQLNMVTSMSSEMLPYLAAKIERNPEGEVGAIRRVAGVGLRIPEDEHDPFPFNPI